MSDPRATLRLGSRHAVTGVRVDDLHEARGPQTAAVPFGVRQGRLIHVSELDDSERGLACGCVCPSCGDRLVARLGAVRAHHFSHAANRSCEGNRESALHLFAKEVFQRHDRFKTPVMEVSWRLESEVVCDPVHVPYEQVLVEPDYGSVRPDIVLVPPRASRRFWSRSPSPTSPTRGRWRG